MKGLAIAFFPLLIFTGCANKTIVKKELIVKKVYVKRKCPKLKIFEINKSIILTAYNKNNKICIKEWNSCIPQKEMINLISYIKYLKEINLRYKEEIQNYNKKFTK